MEAAAEAIVGPRATALARRSLRSLSAMLSPAASMESQHSAASEGDAAAEEAPPPPPPVPAGSLSLTIGRISLEGGSTADCFLVLKCGPHWGRSRPLPVSGALPEGGRRCSGGHAVTPAAHPNALRPR